MKIEPLEPELVGNLHVEFGDYGDRAARLMETARGFLELDEKMFPEVGCAVTACLREAMTSVLKSAEIRSGEWKKVSREVVAAHKRLRKAAHDVAGRSYVPCEGIEGAWEELSAKITALGDSHDRRSFHGRRLVAVLLERTGGDTLTLNGISVVKDYTELLGKFNKVLHGSLADYQAEQFWCECVSLFQRLFALPEVKRARLKALAQREPTATPGVVDDVYKRLVSPGDLEYFLGKVESPAWLDALTPKGVLDPPGVDDAADRWPARFGVVRLAKEHPEDVTRWLRKMHDNYKDNVEASSHIAWAASSIGGCALPLILEAVKKQPQDHRLVTSARLAIGKLDATDRLVESFVDVLFNEQPRNVDEQTRNTGNQPVWREQTRWYVDDWHAERLLEKLSGGVNRENALQRIELLRHKIGKQPEKGEYLPAFWKDPAGSIADREDREHQKRLSCLLMWYMTDIIKKAWEWIPASELMNTLEDKKIPAALRGRFRAWMLANAPDIEPELLVVEIGHAIASRRPTGDDLPLIDRAIDFCEPAVYVCLWRDALGPAPTVAQAAEVKATITAQNGPIPSDWRRIIWWAGLLPDKVAGEWRTPIEIVTAPHGPTGREYLEKRRSVKTEIAESPFTVEELGLMDPSAAAEKIAEWRPEPYSWNACPLMLAQTLEIVVRNAPERWFASPVRIVTKLYHPTYIRHYLQAAATVADDKLPVRELVEAIKLVRRNPWKPVQLSDAEHGYDYDNDWEPSEQAAIRLIQTMATAGCTFNGAADNVWEILESEVTGQLQREGRPQGETAWMAGAALDPRDRAINNQLTIALQAMLSILVNEFRENGTVRPEAAGLLDWILDLPGTIGAEHRAIILERLDFLRHALKNWFDGNCEKLFGDQAPEGLGQTTIDMALKWRSPDKWLLGNYREGVQNAVKRNVENALGRLMLAMLWEIPGYCVQETIALLHTTANHRQSATTTHMPSPMSQSGRVLSSLLRDCEPESRYLEIATDFWEKTLEKETGVALLGFGWFSKLETMNQERWEELTLKTVKKALHKPATPRPVPTTQNPNPTTQNTDNPATANMLQEDTERLNKGFFATLIAERIATSHPSTTGLKIMDMLVRRLPNNWTWWETAEKAVEIFASARKPAKAEAEDYQRAYQRLHNALIERNAVKN